MFVCNNPNNHQTYNSINTAAVPATTLTMASTERQMVEEVQGLSAVRAFVARATQGRDPSHGEEHMWRVCCNAYHIAKDFEARGLPLSSSFAPETALRIVALAAMVHDTIDHKYPGEVTHSQLEEELACILMTRTSVKDSANNNNNNNDSNADCDGHVKKDVAAIMTIIDNISYSKEKREGYPHHLGGALGTMRDVVSDADKIEAIGRVGIERCIEYTRHAHPEYDSKEMAREVLAHVEEKLLNLYGSYIRTPKGRQMAEHGHQEMVRFAARLKETGTLQDC